MNAPHDDDCDGLDEVQRLKAENARLRSQLQRLREAHFLGEQAGQSRRFLQEVTRIVPSVIYVFNQQTMANEYANRSLGEAIGYSAAEVQALGADFLPRLLHPDDIQPVFDNFERIRSLQDGELARIEYRIRHRDGRYRWLQSLDMVFDRNADGNVVRHLGVATDITPIKETQADLLRINEELEELAYATSHDLKAPINTILSFLQFLQQDPSITSPESRQALHWIEKAAKQSSTRLDHLSAVARARRGDDRAAEALSLQALWDAAALSLNTEITACDVIITSHLTPDIQIHFSHAAASSILENLLSNAIKYRAPDRRPHIIVTATQVGQRVALSVEDNGIGIDLKRDRHKVFGLFKRANNTVDGDGIGLYIVRKLVERAGGHVHVQSALGSGSTFTVTFPAPEPLP